MVTTSSILESLSATATSSTTTDRLATDKNTFLTLLVAQLTHQDPLNPTEDKEFVSQLAQFSSLEQLQSINDSIAKLTDSMAQTQLISGASFIGKDVLAAGNEITKVSDTDGTAYTTDLVFTIDSAIQKGQVNIFDSSGNLVHSSTISACNAGTYTFQWDGTNTNGQTVADGIYTATVSCQDANDKSVLATTQCVGRVVGVENSNGSYNLILSGGRTVAFTDVVEIYEASTSTGSSSSGTSDSSASGTETGTEAETEISQ